MTPQQAQRRPIQQMSEAPLVQRSLSELLARVSLLMAAAAALYVLGCVLLHGIRAFGLSFETSAGLRLHGLGHELGTVAATLTTPLVLWAYVHGKRGDLRGGGFWLAIALFVLGLLTVVPRGIHSPGWYLQPLLTILVAVTFGIVPGLAMALLGAATLLLTAWAEAEGVLAASQAAQGLWNTSLVIAAVILATGLVGSFAHRVVRTAISVEVTQSKRLRETLALLRDRERLLGHAMRVETIGGVAGLLVHQLRNQLQVISGYAALGRSGGIEDKQNALEQVNATVKDTKDLVQQMLDLAHPEAGEARMVDVGDLAMAFVDNARRLLPAAIAIKSEVESRRFPCWLDPQGLMQSLWNLTFNSKQAMQDGGELRIRLRRDGRRAVLEVADTGCGIKPEDLPRIFSPYFTTKPKGEGTGLGLAAVARFLQGCGGRVEAASVLGKGTTITLVFPIAENHETWRGRSTREATA